MSDLSEIKTDVKWLVQNYQDTKRWQDKIEKHLSQLNNRVQAHDTTLYGEDSSNGICTDFKVFRKEYYSFRRIVFIVIGILIGSGVLSVSLFEILK